MIGSKDNNEQSQSAKHHPGYGKRAFEYFSWFPRVPSISYEPHDALRFTECSGEPTDNNKGSKASFTSPHKWDIQTG